MLKPHFEILIKLLENELFSFYSIYDFINVEDNIENLMGNLDLDELIYTINILSVYYENNNIDSFLFKLLCKEKLSSTIKDYIENINTSDYCDN